MSETLDVHPEPAAETVSGASNPSATNAATMTTLLSTLSPSLTLPAAPYVVDSPPPTFVSSSDKPLTRPAEWRRMNPSRNSLLGAPLRTRRGSSGPRRKRGPREYCSTTRLGQHSRAHMHRGRRSNTEIATSLAPGSRSLPGCRLRRPLPHVAPEVLQAMLASEMDRTLGRRRGNDAVVPVCGRPASTISSCFRNPFA